MDSQAFGLGDGAGEVQNKLDKGLGQLTEFLAWVKWSLATIRNGMHLTLLAHMACMG